MTEDPSSTHPGRPPLDLAGWVRVLVLGLAGLIALWFCLRSIAFGLWEREYPLIGQTMSPPSAVSEALISLNRASARNGLADPLARELLARAIDRDPLLADPFIVAGLDASARNDLGRAQALMEEAQRRDPRAIIPRYWLFDNYLRDGDYAKGIAEAEPLMRLQPAAKPAAVAVLTALIKVPAARAPLMDALRQQAPWRGAFFQQAAASPSLRDDAAALLREVSSNQATGTGREQKSIVDSLIQANRYADAYQAWLLALPADQRPAEPGVVDGGFNGTADVPPFGWRLPAGGGMIRKISVPDAPSGSGLAIRTSGDRTITIAEQLVLAKAGPITLSWATRALEQGEAGAGLKVQLRCGAKGKALATETVERFGQKFEEHQLSTNLPENCGAALIRFSVAPGLEPGPLNALLTNVSLRRS